MYLEMFVDVCVMHLGCIPWISSDAQLVFPHVSGVSVGGVPAIPPRDVVG